MADVAKKTRCPTLPDLVAHFLYDQHTPVNTSRVDVDPSRYPRLMGKVYSYTFATAIFYASSDPSVTGGMCRQCIYTTPLWRNTGLEQYDCIFAEKNPTLPSFQGIFVAQVLHLFDFHFQNQLYPCALVHWFDTIGDKPCINIGMWMVQPEYDDQGASVLSVIHLDSIMWPAHLIGIYGANSIPRDLHFSDSLSAFSASYINKYLNYHAYKLAF